MRNRITISIVLLISVLLMTTTVSAENKVKPVTDNNVKVTKISKIDINKPKWCTGCYVYLRNNSSWITNIYGLSSAMGAEPYWRMGKKDNYYAIYKTDEKHYLIMTFSGPYFIDGWYVSKIPSEELFHKYVMEGTSLDVIKLIDPDVLPGDYGEEGLESCHHLKDGTIASIIYKKASGKWIVDRISYIEDGSKAVDNLLDIDYDLIKNENPNEEAEFIQKLKELNDKKNKPVKTKVKTPSKVKIKTAKRTGKKKITVRFYKVKNAKKYQIQYAYNRKFKNAKKKVTVKNKLVLKVKAKKNCFIRVRGINQNKKGRWSKVKKVVSQK